MGWAGEYWKNQIERSCPRFSKSERVGNPEDGSILGKGKECSMRDVVPSGSVGPHARC